MSSPWPYGDLRSDFGKLSEEELNSAIAEREPAHVEPAPAAPRAGVLVFALLVVLAVIFAGTFAAGWRPTWWIAPW